MFLICSMDTNPSATPPNASDQLFRAIYYQITHTLRGQLPDPATNTPEALALRDFAAIAHVASLQPVSAEEANVAALCVACDAQALQSLREAREHPDDIDVRMQCVAQSASMMRQAKSWRLYLLRLQTGRQLRDANPTATEIASAIEQRALAHMAEALAQAPPPEPSAPPAAAPQPDLIAEAEQYALQHRRRAALIRRFGRIPNRMNFGPLRPELIRTIATATTPILMALEDKPQRDIAAAA